MKLAPLEQMLSFPYKVEFLINIIDLPFILLIDKLEYGIIILKQEQRIQKTTLDCQLPKLKNGAYRKSPYRGPHWARHFLK